MHSGRIWSAMLLSGLLVYGQTGSSLQIKILDGQDANVTAGAVSSQRLQVEVTDAQGNPVSGATVHFRLPSHGASGHFASGFQTESMMTGDDGQASVHGISWNATPGEVRVQVSAARAGERTMGEIVLQVNGSGGAETAQSAHRSSSSSNGRLQAPSSNKKWFILAAVAGAAVVGVAMAAGGKGSSGAAAAPPSAVVPPTISVPTIVIGKP